MSIDFSKKPEGATHYKGLRFYKVSGGVVYRYSPLNGQFHRVISFEHDLNPLPDKQWGGEVLPPVGTECEYFDTAQEKWGRAFIVAHDICGEQCIWREDKGGGSLYYGVASDFRPLQTPEQKEAQEREKAVQEMFDIYVNSSTQHEGIENLYDAGYRKQAPATA